VPEVLFHRAGGPADPWRPADAALVAAGRRAVVDTCCRRRIAADVVPLVAPGTYRVRRAVPAARVSVIVPFRDGAVLLRRCVRSLLDTCAGSPPEIVLVDNGSVEEDTHRLLAELVSVSGVRIVAAPGAFNFATLVNRGAAAASGDVLCLLNSDVEAIAPGWLEALVEHATRPEVGAVGARLLYPDGSLQHGGVALGIDGATEHVERFAARDAPGPFAALAVVREVSAVTAACLATRRDVFARLGGFDEAFPSAYNDVDYCLRLEGDGLSILCTPHAELLHHEGGSRGRVDPGDAALALLRARWGGRPAHDPYWRLGASPPPSSGWAARQRRRIGWLARDLRDGLARGWQTAAGARRRDDAAGIALLAGGAVAVPGDANRYRLRIVNPTDHEQAVTVAVRAAAGRVVLEHTAPLGLAARSSQTLALETDWRGRLAIVDDDRPVSSPPARPATARGRLVATVRAGGSDTVAALEVRLLG
jgi:GT2 family glycosyltransferase